LPNGLTHNTLTYSWPALLNSAKRVARNHPRRLTALVAALALCGAGGAFAIASLAPDAADLPVRQVFEPVNAIPTQSTLAPEMQSLLQQIGQPAAQPLARSWAESAGQMSSPETPALTLYRSDISRASDTADTLLKRLGISDPKASAFLRNDATVRQSLLGRGGRSLTAEATPTNTLLKLTARWSTQDDVNFTRLVIQQTPQGLKSRLETAPLVASTRLASGTIQSSLFAATDEARLPDSVAVQVAEIFSTDIDFHRALRKGDRFSITYEALEGDGEPLRSGRVMSAEFVNNGKTYQAMWFGPSGTAAQANGAGPVGFPVTVGKSAPNTPKGAYYTLDGKSLRRAYLASPLEFSRITSGFKMRLHPIFQTWKAHLGVDYAAPTGTAVRSIGDGVVEFAGVQSGFGNVVFVNHGKENTTVYAHLSKINVQKGEKVSQSQTIGAVGSTGWATGPHLHFEFRINGVHQDPLTLALNNDTAPVTAALKQQFDVLSASTRVALAAAASIHQATAE
jgi:murein DD-endopeptidase MepM/ murein hydrolase activator NlpD